MFTYNNALGQFVFEDDPDDDDNKNDKPSGGGKSKANATKDPPAWASEFGDEFDPQKAYEALLAARRAERSAKNELTKSSSKLKELEDAEKTELVKAQERIAEMEKALEGFTKQARDAKLREAVAETAKKHGALYPDDIYALVQSELDVDSDGKITNADNVVKTFKANRPALFAKQGVDGRTAVSNGDKKTESDMNTGIRALFGR